MGNTVLHMWRYIVENGTLSAFFLMLWTFMVKCLLISVYFSLLYCGITRIKEFLYKKMSIHANYYSWYCILFSVVLVNLGISNYIISLSYQPLYSWSPNRPYFFLTGCLLSAVWLSVVICKLTALTLLNLKIRKSMKRMESFDDNEGLAEQAASTFGLRKMPDIWVADYIETPVSYGVFKKVILLPVDYEEKYTHGELYLLLLHEMAHIKHGDTVKLCMINLAECFLWITPAMRLFIKNFKRDSEVLCDNCVIGLQSDERDTYGNLILKECVRKNTSFGFSFSDSYHTIENRLDALYRYKDKASGRSKLFAVIPAAVLMICALSYTFRADWFVVNNEYNSEFEVVVFDAGYTDFVLLPTEACAGVYELEAGSIIVDTKELYNLTWSYADKGYSEVKISSYNYVAETNAITLCSGSGHLFDIHELAGGQDEYTPFIQKLEQRTPIEYLFLLIASKL